MKKPIIFLALMLYVALVSAQTADNGFLLSGSVMYEQISKLNIQMEGDGAAFSDALPKEHTSRKILHFSEEASLYENYHAEEPAEQLPMEGGGVMIQMEEPENKTFTDLAHHKMIEQREFMSRSFLVESELPSVKWKITGNQRNVLDYPCQEAVREVDSMQVHVWFTPRIPVPAGPGEYVGLPGLVLAVESHGGDRKLTAVSVELKPVDAKLLKQPTKGKKVSGEEYDALVAEKLEEMGVEHSEGGGASHTWVIEIKQ
jgi:GLPGLI family protein